jgi:enoyl-CoA hydratase/carnithine racemase
MNPIFKEHPMTDLGTYRDIGVSLDGNVATVEIRRPPHNFFDSDLIAQIGEAL